MAREFAKVTHRLWHGSTARALRDYPDAHRLATYLIAGCEAADWTGIYVVKPGTIADDLNLPRDFPDEMYEQRSARPWRDVRQGVCAAIKTLVDDGFCKYDHASGVVWVVGAAPIQIGTLPSPHTKPGRDKRACIRNHLARIAADAPELAAEWLAMYGDRFHLSESETPGTVGQARRPRQPASPTAQSNCPVQLASPTAQSTDLSTKLLDETPRRDQETKRFKTLSHTRAHEGPPRASDDPRDIPADAIDPQIEPGVVQRLSDVARQLSQTEARDTIGALYLDYTEAVRRMYPSRTPSLESACVPGLSRVLVCAARASRETGERPYDVARRIVVQSVRCAGEHGQYVANLTSLWGSDRQDPDGTRLYQHEAETRSAAPSRRKLSPELEEAVAEMLPYFMEREGLPADEARAYMLKNVGWLNGGQR